MGTFALGVLSYGLQIQTITHLMWSEGQVHTTKREFVMKAMFTATLGSLAVGLAALVAALVSEEANFEY